MLEFIDWLHMGLMLASVPHTSHPEDNKIKTGSVLKYNIPDVAHQRRKRKNKREHLPVERGRGKE